MKNIKVTATDFSTVKAMKEALKVHGIGSMFSVNADAKTVKGNKLNYNTAILYMTPDYTICPASKRAKCDVACLVSAGRGKFNSVKQARQNKTVLFKSDKSVFFGSLIKEIESLIKKHGDTLVVRLNGTSDIAYENISINYKGKNYKNIFELFSTVTFYDYTKIVNRVTKVLPSNYDLTLSYSGANPVYADNVINYGKKHNTRVAVVFSSKELPKTFKGMSVVNGDETDLRFLDESNVVVGLYAKGDAKKDTSGFVVIAKG